MSYVPATSLLGIYLRYMKTYVHKKTWAGVFITALFIIATNYPQCKCLPGEWIKTLWHIHTMGYYLAIMDKEGITIHVTPFVNVKKLYVVHKPDTRVHIV